MHAASERSVCFVAFIILALEQNSLRQDLIQHLDQLVLISAAVIPHVENQRLRALCDQLVHGGVCLLRAARIKIGDFEIADLSVQHFIGCNGRLDAAALNRKREAFFSAQDRQRHKGSFFTANLCARPGHAKVERFFALDLCDDIADENSGFLRRASRGHGLDAHTAERFLRRDGHADADIGVAHLFIIAAFFFGSQIITPAVAGRLDHGGGSRVSQLVFVIIVNKKGIKICADLCRFGLDGRLLAARKLHGHDSRAKDCNGECKHKKNHFLPFFQDGYQPFRENSRIELDTRPGAVPAPGHVGYIPK